jgi:hypothetical protein
MGAKPIKPLFPLILFLSIIFFLSACSTPSWLPIKKGPPHQAKKKELLDKEVILIDRHEYVKVLNPRASEGGNQPKYLYVPMDEYLAKRESFTSPSVKSDRAPKALPAGTPLSPAPAPEIETVTTSVSVLPDSSLKKKVMITHFDDHTTSAEEALGDWLAEKLVKEVTRRSPYLLTVDYRMVMEFLGKRGSSPSALESPETLRTVSEIFGIHAVVLGELTGPYVFTTKGARDQDATSSAIIKIEMKIIDTFSGKILNSVSAQNAISPTKERGMFADERAKGRAFDLTLTDLSRSLSGAMDRLEWFCRVAKVDGESVYINAGKLSGLKVGDVMDVFRPQKPGDRGEAKGKIQILALFGLDASIGRMIQGKRPEEEDLLRFAGREGT